VPFESLGVVSYLPSIVTMAISCIVCEISRLIGRKSRNFYTPPVFNALQGVTLSEFCEMFDAGKTRMIGLSCGEKNCDDLLSRFHLILESNGQTDGRTDRFAISISRVSMLTRDKNVVTCFFGTQCRFFTCEYFSLFLGAPVNAGFSA